MTKKLFISIIAAGMLFICGVDRVKAQSEPNRFALGINAGGSKYWGEFTDNQFWLAGDVFGRYNFTSYFSLQVSVGLSQLRYKVDADQIRQYPDFFGLNAKIGDKYPNVPETKIKDVNAIRINSYEANACYNIFPSQTFVPYLSIGLGYINWEAKAGESGGDGNLPNNQNKVYTKGTYSIPVGVGFEVYLTDDMVLNGKGTFRFTGTDYLDDYKHESSANDAFATFGLGLSYYVYGEADYDKDGLTNQKEREIGTDPRNPDTDGDGLKDGEEVLKYSTNPLSIDTDGDGLRDFDEIFTYKTDPKNPDTDGDGLKDGEEIARKTDPRNPDTDGDRLIDGDEVYKYQTDPLEKDTDGDGLSDGDEILKYSTNPKSIDTDADGLGDGDEVLKYLTNPKSDDTDADGLKDGSELKVYKTNPLDPDTDKDGLQDGEEINKYKTDPLKPDTDGDGLNDGDEVNKYSTNPNLVDSDMDGLSDGDEVLIYKTNPNSIDTDKDGLKDYDEINVYKTNPNNFDTDGDGLNDGDEVMIYKTSPIKLDTDDDKLSDFIEITKSKTDPLNPDTDGDSIIDGEDDCPLIPGIPSSEKGKNGCAAPPKIGTKTDFPDILFIFDSDKFNYDHPGTIKNLMKLLEYINQCDGLQVKIEGHASAEGSETHNQTLSDKRAAKVKQWLVEQGVPASKIGATKGFGSSQPKVKEPGGKDLKKISKEKLEEIRKQNRRITVEVVKTCE